MLPFVHVSASETMMTRRLRACDSTPRPHLWATLCVCAIALTSFFALARAQGLEKPLQNIDEDITAFAFAPDGRIVYSVNRGFKTKQYDLEHDDIWIQDAGGKRRRIFVGEKFTRGNTSFTYSVNSFRWSPNGKKILAELFMATVDETGKTTDSTETLVLEDTGKEVKGSGNEKQIENSDNATWLLDNNTVIYMTEVLKPRVLYSFKYLNLTGGPSGNVFEGRTFLEAVPVPRSNLAIAVERDRSLSGPPRLQRLELLAQDDRELATLEGFNGGLSLSSSGNKIAYFIDRETLEIRDLTDLTKVARARIGLGVFHWAPDDAHILLKRALEKKSGDLVWIELPPLASHPTVDAASIPISQPTPVPFFRGNTIRDFAISPDGKWLGVIPPGRRNLAIYTMSAP
jgi:dipeptidyl aminopeptidase/acylaminoacyl peptidase